MKVLFAVLAILAVVAGEQAFEKPSLGDYVFQHVTLLAERAGINMTSADAEIFRETRGRLNQITWKAEILGYENPYFGEHLFMGVDEDEVEAKLEQRALLAEAGVEFWGSGSGSGSSTGCQPRSGTAPTEMAVTALTIGPYHNLCTETIHSSNREFYDVFYPNTDRHSFGGFTEGCHYRGNGLGLGNASCNCACRDAYNNRSLRGHIEAEKHHVYNIITVQCICREGCQGFRNPFSIVEVEWTWNNFRAFLKSLLKPIVCDCMFRNPETFEAERKNCSCITEIAFELINRTIENVAKKLFKRRLYREIRSFFAEFAFDTAGCHGISTILGGARERLRVALQSTIASAFIDAAIELAAAFIPVAGWVKAYLMSKKYVDVFAKCAGDFWNVLVKIVRWMAKALCYDGTSYNLVGLVDSAAGAVGCYVGARFCTPDKQVGYFDYNSNFKLNLAEIKEREVSTGDADIEESLNLAEIKTRAVSTWDSDIAEALRFFSADTTRDHTAGIGFLNGLRDYVRAL